MRIAESTHIVTAVFDGIWWSGDIDGTAWYALAVQERLELMVGGNRVVLTSIGDTDLVRSSVDDAAIAPMPGVVVVVSVGVGDRVAKGAVVAIVEAMKMENKSSLLLPAWYAKYVAASRRP